jgi:hypothetical protein
MAFSTFVRRDRNVVIKRRFHGMGILRSNIHGGGASSGSITLHIGETSGAYTESFM